MPNLNSRVEWQKMPIKNIYLGMYDGVHGTPPPSQDGPIFLGIKNLTDDGKFDFSDIRHISEEDFARWTKRILPKEGDIVFTYEATLHRYAIIPRGFRGCLGRRLALIRPDNNKIATKFLFYYFFSEDWRNTINKNIFSGATVDRIPIIHFPNFEIFVPPLPTQQKIAVILSSYDDLIKNNTRRIKILEEMAQTLYREWFVDFRFPGHEGVRMVESDVGKIPEGWRIFQYRDIIESSLGGDWGVDEPNADENKPVKIIRGTDFKEIRNGIFDQLPKRYISASSLEKRKLQSMDIIIENSVNAKSRTAGTNLLITDDYLTQIENDTIAASFCRVFRPKEPRFSPLIHLHLKNLFSEGKMSFYQNVATNGIANFQTTRLLEKEAIILPDNEKLQNFMLTALSNLTHSKLIEKNANLRRTRDLLLPKLISGEIDVSGLDIRIPEAEA